MGRGRGGWERGKGRGERFVIQEGGERGWGVGIGGPYMCARYPFARQRVASEMPVEPTVPS